MKTIHNSDIRFELNPRIIYVSDFEMTFYTVSRGEYYFKKTDADVIEAEVSGDTKYYLDLDWSMLEYVGQGVLNYQCVNNIADPSFPDGEYNQLIEKTTDYFIDTFTVEPEGDESIAERLEKEEEERKEADAVISGAVSTEIERAQSAETALQEAIDAETSARTTADETLNNAITAETSARTAADEALSGAVDTKLQDYYLKSETSGKTELETAFSGKSDTGHTHDERYYRKDETSGATELEAALNRKLDASAYTPTDLSNYYTKDETSGKSEIASAISDEATARANADTALSGAVDTALLGYVNNAAYVSTAKTINLLNGSTVIASIDATDFIKDGMVDNVVISGGSLVITFNTDSGKEAITIALTDIFDPSIYYTKTEIDGIVSGKADTTAVTQAITEATSGKANSSDVYLKTETSGKTELNTAFSAKLDVTAYTPTDLSNYYTKSETSGATELTTAFAAKLDATAYTPTDLSNYYTKSEVDEMSEVAAQGINDLNTNKLDVTAYTPTDLTNYYTKSETSGKTEIQTALGTKQDTLVSGTNIKTVNNESLLGSGNITIQGGGNNVVELTQAQYDALTTKDPDTFYVITDATPADLSNYYTKSETSGATELNAAFSAKLDATAYTPTDLSNYYTKSETSGKTELDAAFNGYVTTDTEQTISGRKVFTYSSSNSKAILFKQTTDSAKVGFMIINSADTNNQLATFELRPNTFTINGVKRPLMYFGHYRDTNTANAGVPQTVIGFRQYDQTNAAAYHMLAPLPEKAKTPFSLTTTFQDFYMPMGFKNGSTMVKADETGVVDLSSIITGGTSINVVQTTGSSSADVMSQDAVTTALSGKQGTLTTGHLVDITNGTISVDLPISAGTSGNYSMLIGAPDINSVASGDCAIASGYFNRAYGDYARADGQGNEAVGNYSYALGCYNSTANEAEFSIGKYNNGRVIYDGEGIVDYTVFTVGNGTSMAARHNAFEVRNSGDIYITSGNSDIKLQDYLGGVNSSTVQTMIDNSISGKADTTAVTTTLGNYYTKSQTSGASEITQALQAKANGSDVYLKSETSGATEITVALINKADTSAVTEVATAVATKANSADVYDKTAADILLDGKANVTDVYTKAQTSGSSEISTALLDKADKGDSYLKSETSSKTQIDIALVAKANVSDVYTKSETSGKTELSMAFAAKQDTLVSGTNIKTINNESILGSGNITIEGGGGKAVSGGTNISITTGETADTINCTLPFSHSTSPKRIVGDSQYSLLIGKNNGASTYAQNSLVVGENSRINNGSNINCAVAIGYASTANTSYSTAIGTYVKTNNSNELSTGKYNQSNTGSTNADKTLFSVGNGTADNARHNAFEIRQNGDIYITSGGTDIKLQDNLGGGSSINVVQTTGTSTTDVMSQDAVTTALSGKADAADLGGLKLQQVTQAEYDAITNKDASTLYVIVN